MICHSEYDPTAEALRKQLGNTPLYLCDPEKNASCPKTHCGGDEAIISLPDGEVVKGKVKSWRDYEDGDQIQVTIGKKTYLVHSSNVALIVNHEP